MVQIRGDASLMSIFSIKKPAVTLPKLPHLVALNATNSRQVHRLILNRGINIL